MSGQELHDVKNLLRRLELIAELLEKRDYSTFTHAEMSEDATRDLAALEKLFSSLISNGR
ncbi:MAG: hypothetical protein ACLGG7_02270 [Bacteriovoracia bacterium]